MGDYMSATKQEPVMGSQAQQAVSHEANTAPRITPADIAANIVSEHYFTADQGVSSAAQERAAASAQPIPDGLRLLTFCVLVLKNGFTVTGESACVSAKNFDAEIGRQIARQHAMETVWPLMGYELRSTLYQQAPAA